MIDIEGSVWRAESSHSIKVRYYFKIKKTWFRGDVTVYYSARENHKRFNLKHTLECCSLVHYSKIKAHIIETSGILVWKRKFRIEKNQLKKIFYYSPKILEYLS